MPADEIPPNLQHLSGLADALPRMKMLLATRHHDREARDALTTLMQDHAGALVALAEASLDWPSKALAEGDVTIVAFQPLGEAYQTVGRLFRGDAIVSAGDLHAGGYAWESDATSISVERVFALLGAGVVKADRLTQRPGVRYAISADTEGNGAIDP